MPDPYDVFSEIRNATAFTVTNEHLLLIGRFYVDWDDCEFGAPSIDPKRPYGNSDVIGDIAEILGVPASQWQDADEYPLPDAEAHFTRLHAETAIVLQIAISTSEFRAGRYERSKYGTDWHRMGD